MSGQSSRNVKKGKQHIRGIVHVNVGMDEEWATSKSKRKAHLRNVMSVSTTKKPS